MTIQELREKRAQAWDEARNFLDSKRNDSGLLSEEDSKTYDKMEAEIVALGKEIDRLERQEKLAAQMNAPTSNPILGKPATPEITEKQAFQAMPTKLLSGTMSATEIMWISATTSKSAKIRREVIFALMSLKKGSSNPLRKRIFSVRLQQ